MSILKLFRTLGEAALQANLSKNEAKIFQHLINKTLTFSKLTADQTDSTIVYLTRIRQDRAKQAIESLIKKGFFTRTPVKIFSQKRGWVDGYRYHIAPAFLTDIDADFFGSENPKKRPKSRPKCGDIHSKNNTNNKQHNTHGQFFDENKQMDIECCSSRELSKPENVDLSTYENLLPALNKLKTPQAQNVLDVLSCAITDQSIKTTPIRLGFGLIKQAHAGLLNTACLQTKQNQQQKAHINQAMLDKAERLAELNGLRQQAKLLGIPLEQHAKNLNQAHLLEV